MRILFASQLATGGVTALPSALYRSVSTSSAFHLPLGGIVQPAGNAIMPSHSRGVTRRTLPDFGYGIYVRLQSVPVCRAEHAQRQYAIDWAIGPSPPRFPVLLLKGERVFSPFDSLAAAS